MRIPRFTWVSSLLVFLCADHFYQLINLSAHSLPTVSLKRKFNAMLKVALSLKHDFFKRINKWFVFKFFKNKNRFHQSFSCLSYLILAHNKTGSFVTFVWNHVFYKKQFIDVCHRVITCMKLWANPYAQSAKNNNIKISRKCLELYCHSHMQEFKLKKKVH